MIYASFNKKQKRLNDYWTIFVSVRLYGRKQNPIGTMANTIETLEQLIMDYLPNEPNMLVSAVNMLLRDEEFDSLESLCYSFDRNPQEISDYLFEHGYVYDNEQKQFRPVGYK